MLTVILLKVLYSNFSIPFAFSLHKLCKISQSNYDGVVQTVGHLLNHFESKRLNIPLFTKETLLPCNCPVKHPHGKITWLLA